MDGRLGRAVGIFCIGWLMATTSVATTLPSNFTETTGYVYVMNTVDRNHLINCDTPQNGAPTCGGGCIAADTWQPSQQYLDPPTNSRPKPGYFKVSKTVVSI